MSELRVDFDRTQALIVDRSGHSPAANQPWAPVIITSEEIDAAVERLARLPRPADGRREALIVHPSASMLTPGLAPGIQVTLSVLKPGESTTPFRHNATEINFCIRGSGQTVTQQSTVSFKQYDVWNMPSYVPYTRRNDGKDLQVCLVYTNAALLQFMQVYLAEANPPVREDQAQATHEDADNPRRKSRFGTFALGNDGAMLMPYEQLINPPAVESKALHWPWEGVRSELRKLEALGAQYVGRRLYLLYNPVTGRTNGTTPNFFATMTIRPPNIIDRPHRHVSAAINYYFQGSGYSSVGGNIYHWKAGDLMLSAPGWVVHNHASGDEAVHELTVQDQPLNIAMESLLWQENLKVAPVVLGTQVGFDTNRNTEVGS